MSGLLLLPYSLNLTPHPNHLCSLPPPFFLCDSGDGRSFFDVQSSGRLLSSFYSHCLILLHQHCQHFFTPSFFLTAQWLFRRIPASSAVSGDGEAPARHGRSGTSLGEYFLFYSISVFGFLGVERGSNEFLSFGNHNKLQ